MTVYHIIMENKQKFRPDTHLRLMDQVRQVMRYHHYAYRTGKTYRHCFATHMLENGVNIRVVQELMAHADVKTTEIYTHVMEKKFSTVFSPLDALNG
ncbi:MAG: tyrosine-type recombinase/integrase [Proteobacteria bacterium]|nr:tyrosine-type recombinase/integrase [Pseudomonadota bacterium]